MRKHVIQKKRKNVGNKNEIWVIILGLACAYGGQILGFLMGGIILIENQEIENIIVKFKITPMMVHIVCLGIFKMILFQKLTKKELCILAFLIPFTIICIMIMLIDKVPFLSTLEFWFENASVSLIVETILLSILIVKKLISYAK